MNFFQMLKLVPCIMFFWKGLVPVMLNDHTNTDQDKVGASWFFYTNGKKRLIRSLHLLRSTITTLTLQTMENLKIILILYWSV